MNNLSSYCGLVDAKIRAYDKDLPVPSFNKQHIKKILGSIHIGPCLAQIRLGGGPAVHLIST